MVAVIFSLDLPRVDSYLDKIIRMFELFSLRCEIICLENWIHSLLGFRDKPSETFPAFSQTGHDFLTGLVPELSQCFTQRIFPGLLHSGGGVCSSEAADAWGGRRWANPLSFTVAGLNIWRQSDLSQGEVFVVEWIESIPLFPQSRRCHVGTWGREHAKLVFRQSHCIAIPDG